MHLSTQAAILLTLAGYGVIMLVGFLRHERRQRLPWNRHRHAMRALGRVTRR